MQELKRERVLCQKLVSMAKEMKFNSVSCLNAKHSEKVKAKERVNEYFCSLQKFM